MKSYDKNQIKLIYDNIYYKYKIGFNLGSTCLNFGPNPIQIEFDLKNSKPSPIIVLKMII